MAACMALVDSKSVKSIRKFNSFNKEISVDINMMMDYTGINKYYTNRIYIFYWVGIWVAVATVKVGGTKYVWICSEYNLVPQLC